MDSLSVGVAPLRVRHGRAYTRVEGRVNEGRVGIATWVQQRAQPTST